MENSQPATVAHLQQRIAELEAEKAAWHRRPAPQAAGASVIVPPELQPLFDAAQQTVGEYFTDLKMDPATGTVEINDQRYLLVRASALSKDFLDTIRSLYADRPPAEAASIGRNFLFDIAHALGMNDAKNFHQKMNLQDPIAKLSAGPVHFAYTGWAFVEILAESIPLPNDDFYLIYHHPFSFEADSWTRSGQRSSTPVCIMSAGYSSGWCEESFGIPLTAVEVSCTARGDERCTFIMSPPQKIQDHLDRFHLQGSGIGKQPAYDIPTFFERKKVEEEMQRSKALAESSARTKEEFVANTSHELRTPLSAIIGFTDLLKKTALDDTQREYVEAISTSGDGLLSIINDILDLSKLDAGKGSAEAVPFSVPELLQSVHTMFAAKAAAKGLRLSVIVDAALTYPVYGDPMRLTQLLVNLVGNAVKFTEKGSIKLSCTVENETETGVVICFEVKDTGIGIAEEMLPHIFERFTQADAAITRKYGGTGLGLAICQRLAALLGGNLTVRSKQGEGTTFSVTLSFAKAPAVNLDARPEPLPVPVFSTPKTVLVVEDNPLNQKLTTIILTNNGFRPVLAQNGSEAVERLKGDKVDLILMDIHMPVMDGYEATCIIRDKLHLHTPIVAMTAHALTGEKEKCLKGGINDYLPKPFTEAALLQLIGRWVKEDAPAVRLTNLDFLRAQTRNNEGVIREMVAHFVAHNGADVEALRDAIQRADYPAVAKGVHALRNGVAFFGLTEHIGDALLRMEKAAREGINTESLAADFEAVKKACGQAVAELKTTLV